MIRFYSSSTITQRRRAFSSTVNLFITANTSGYGAWGIYLSGHYSSPKQRSYNSFLVPVTLNPLSRHACFNSSKVRFFSAISKGRYHHYINTYVCILHMVNAISTAGTTGVRLTLLSLMSDFQDLILEMKGDIIYRRL